MKRISFIITYYNESHRMLQECVQSILSLPLQPEEREILLIDDGSKVPAPQFEGVTVVRQENQGLSAARNKGLEMAQGEYIQFLDADDFLLTDAYRHVLDLLSARQPDMLMFRLVHSIVRESPMPRIEHFRSGTEFLRRRNMRSSACGYLFRRSVLDGLRFCPGILHEDELFTPQLLLKAGSLFVVDIPAYYYRVGSGTITHRQDPAHSQKRVQDILFVIRELNRLVLSAQGAEREALLRRVSQLSLDCIYVCWMLTHSIREVRSCLRSLRASGLYPLPLRFYTFKYWIFALTINCLCVFL